MTEIDSMLRHKLKRFLREIKVVRGLHTELVTVYIPAGYELIKIIQHLQQEQGTAVNIKDKTNRQNVVDSLERMIRHLRLFKATPPNGLAVYSGNIASQEGKQDIKVWSMEPPVPLNVRMYRCDKVFITAPLEDMMAFNETFGLIVMDNREGTVGFLKGKSIQVIKEMHSAVPGKFKAGGQCLAFGTMISMANGEKKDIFNLKIGDVLIGYDFKKKKYVDSKCIAIWKRKKRALQILVEKLNILSISLEKEIISSPDHLFFVSVNGKIRKIPANKLNEKNHKLIDRKLNERRILFINKNYEKNMPMIDIETTTGNFFANGFLVHNSQQRFARLREDAANEFYHRIADVVNHEFLPLLNDLKGILIGGPGMTKETFLNGSYINNELKKKVIAVRDLSYTGDYGMHELVERSQDALSEQEITKEKQIVQELLTLLATNSDKVVYGVADVKKALGYGAVDKLLLSEDFQGVDELEDMAEATKTKIFIVSVETKEGVQLRDLGGAAAILRYSIVGFE